MTHGDLIQKLVTLVETKQESCDGILWIDHFETSAYIRITAMFANEDECFTLNIKDSDITGIQEAIIKVGML